MIITASVRKATQAIIDNDTTNTFAVDIINISSANFKEVADDIKAGKQLGSLDGYSDKLAIAVLFTKHQPAFMQCLEEIAYADDGNAVNPYLKSVIDEEDEIIETSLYLMENLDEFERADRWAQQDCYIIMHSVAVHVIRHIIHYYNLATGLMKNRVDAYEASISGE